MANPYRADPTGREPLGITWIDTAALAAGLALAYAFRGSLSPFRGMPFPFVPIPASAILVWMAISLLLALDLVTSLTILVRRFQYGGLPRPAAWLALLATAALLAEAPPNVDEAVNLVDRVRGDTNLDFSLLRWCWAGAAAALASMVFAVLVLARKRMPAGLKTILLLVVAMALLWGPSPVCERELPWLISIPFQPPPGARGLAFWLSIEIREAIGRLPTSLLFGAPIVAAFLDSRRVDRSPWAWTEWVGLGTAALLAILVLVSPTMNLVRFAHQADTIAAWVGWGLQLVATALLSWAIVRGLGPTWNRWIGAGYDRIEAR